MLLWWSKSRQTNKRLRTHIFKIPLLTGDCVVDAWPVLAAVSFQPNSDGPEGKCQNITLKHSPTSSQGSFCALGPVRKVRFGYTEPEMHF